MKQLMVAVQETYTSDALQVIISTNEIIKHCKEHNTGRIDPKMIAVLKEYYQGVSLEQLFLLWHENYNTMMLPAAGEPENGKSHLVRNKVMAIGSLISLQVSEVIESTM